MLLAEKNYLETYNPRVTEQKKVIKKKKAKKLSKNIRTLFAISVFFIIGFVIVLRFTALNEMTNTVNRQKVFLAGLDKTKSQLKAEILIDLDTVDDIAKNKLAMDRPYSYQVEYVNINNNENQISVAQSNASKFDIVKKISKVVEFLY